jgi:hypothetical protein
MIVEVNNTFDERRMYLLLPDETPRGIDLGNENVDETSTDRKLFTQSWPKDFHVSPFNSRKGSYSLSAADPLRSQIPDVGPINTTIVLKSSKSHGKIVARLFSAGSPVDPAVISTWRKLSFLSAWWWVGFVTFPRIVSEAAKLFFRRKLHVWFRPEPLRHSIGRNADKTERQLEMVFRRYLRSLVERSSASLAVKYIPSGVLDRSKELMLSHCAKNNSESVEEMEFKILTPVFYPRFASYAHDLEAIFCEMNESSTIWVSRPDLLSRLLAKRPSPALQASNPVDFAYFKAIQYLRRRPERIQHPTIWPAGPRSADETSHSVMDIREFRISSMDGFVLGSGEPRLRKAYRSSVIKLFIAERIAFGLVPIVEAQGLIVRAWLAWSCARVIRAMSQGAFSSGEI